MLTYASKFGMRISVSGYLPSNNDAIGARRSKKGSENVLIPEFPTRAFPGTTHFDALEQRFLLFTQL
jgi:hypothetical protein